MMLIYWAPSLTSTIYMDNPYTSLGRTLGYVIFSLFLSSNFQSVEFLNTLESLDEP